MCASVSHPMPSIARRKPPDLPHCMPPTITTRATTLTAAAAAAAVAGM